MRLKGCSFKYVAVFLCSMVFSLFFMSVYEADAKALPKRKSLVVAVYENQSGFFRQGLDIGTAEATVKKILIQNGYPVVNEAQFKKIKSNKAAWYAFQGDADALIRLGSKYNVRIFVSGKVSRHVPRKNSMGLYTGTAAISMQAYSTSNGKYLFSDTANGKALGYSPDEASEKALQQAAETMGQKLIGADNSSSGSSPSSSSAISGTIVMRVSNVGDFSRANEILAGCKSLPGASGAKISQYSGGIIVINTQFRGDGRKFVDFLSKKGLSLAFTSINGNSVEAASR